VGFGSRVDGESCLARGTSLMASTILKCTQLNEYASWKIEAPLDCNGTVFVRIKVHRTVILHVVLYKFGSVTLRENTAECSSVVAETCYTCASMWLYVYPLSQNVPF